MSDLQAIVYVSTATRLLTCAQLETLLIEARDLNFQNSVTGMLLYSDGNFMQCFEGSPRAVHETYERIRSSRQHRDIIELLDVRIDVRGFPDWQMGFSRATRSELLTLSNSRWESMKTEMHGAPPTSTGLALLKNFWEHTQK